MGAAVGTPYDGGDFSSDIASYDLTGADISTPRGVSAKNEVIRLRNILVDRSLSTIKAIAKAKFDELDIDRSGFLENKELENVTQWVMFYFGEKMGTNPELVKKRLMDRLDANKDGKLDSIEFENLFNIILQRMGLLDRAKSKFNELDTDKSRFLEKEEIDAVVAWTLQAFPADKDLERYKASLLASVDKNGDQKLSFDEFIYLFEDMLIRHELIKRAQKKFDELDTNKSGTLEKAELDQVAEWVLSAYSEKTDEDRKSFKATLMGRIDKNEDGKLTMQEFAVVFDEICVRLDLREAAKKEFLKLDLDGSGFLEKNELGEVLKIWAKTCGAEVGINPGAALDTMLAATDVNADGKLEFKEFMGLFDKVLQASGIWG